MSENINELREIADQRNKNSLNATSEMIRSMTDEINRPPLLATLPEEVFKAYFLDMFLTGLTEGTKGYAMKWIELARGPYNEVSIIDNVGNELFVAPGLYSLPNVDNDAVREVNVFEVSATYNLKRRIHQGQADAFLASTLSSIPSGVQPAFNNYIVKVAAIADRYREKEDITKPAIASAKANVDNLDDDLFSF